MRIAFYKASAGNWLDKTINLLSGNRGYSHVELVFSDGMSFSSTSRDDTPGGGVRFKRIDFDPAKWDVAGVVCDEWSEEVVRRVAAKLVSEDHGYDYGGVFRLIPVIGGLFHQSEKRYFCSEAVIEVLQEGLGIFMEWGPSYKISPNEFAARIGFPPPKSVAH